MNFSSIFLIYQNDIDRTLIINNPKSSDYLELNPFIIRDSGIGPKDYTWAEAAMESWCSGGGTRENPYIISNIKINAQIQDLCCLYIVSSVVFFKIEDCVFYNSRHVAYGGIKLSHVSNGVINNIKCFDNTVGIRIEDSDNINITNNKISENEYGLMMFNTVLVNIISNNASNNHYSSGISVNNGDSYRIIGNIANNNHYGIFLGVSDSVLISENYAKGNYYGIGVYTTFNSFLINNTIRDSYTGIDFMNSNNNMIYSCNLKNNSDGGGLYIYESFNNNITKNRFLNNNLAIDISSCELNKFKQNVIGSNNYSGIKLFESNENEFLENELISNNYQGIALCKSSNNSFIKNEIFDHSVGIDLMLNSNNNTFIQNNLVNNKECYRMDITSLDNIFIDNICENYENPKILGFQMIILITLLSVLLLFLFKKKTYIK